MNERRAASVLASLWLPEQREGFSHYSRRKLDRLSCLLFTDVRLQQSFEVLEAWEVAGVRNKGLRVLREVLRAAFVRTLLVWWRAKDIIAVRLRKRCRFAFQFCRHIQKLVAKWLCEDPFLPAIVVFVIVRITWKLCLSLSLLGLSVDFCAVVQTLKKFRAVLDGWQLLARRALFRLLRGLDKRFWLSLLHT